jgi:aryl-phospho-beta-D-glucosidase BglC (GH1 family)
MGLEYGTGTAASDSCKFGWGGQDAGFFSATEFDNVASWGFNFVRLPISWENLEPTPPTLQPDGTWTHHWNTQYLDEIDYFVNQFGQRHIAVIPDFHQVDLSPAFQQAPGGVHGTFCEGWGMPTWLYPAVTSPTSGEQLASAVCSFFKDQSLVGPSVPPPIDGLVAAEQMIASRYANNPTVIGLDIFNEPWFSRSCGHIPTVAQLLVSFDTKISTAISTANPRLLIVFEDPPHGLMPQLTSPLITSPPPVPNAVYEVHIYVANWGVAQPLLQAYRNNAEKWGVPLYLGEFNAFEAGNNAIYATIDPNWQADTQSMLAYCKTNGISWSYWSYTSLGTKVPTPVPRAQILSILQGGI